MCECAKVCLGVWQSSTADRKILICPVTVRSQLWFTPAHLRGGLNQSAAPLWPLYVAHFSPWHWPGRSSLLPPQR